MVGTCRISRETLRGRSLLSTTPFTKLRYLGSSCSSNWSEMNTRFTNSLMLLFFVSCSHTLCVNYHSSIDNCTQYNQTLYQTYIVSKYTLQTQQSLGGKSTMFKLLRYVHDTQ